MLWYLLTLGHIVADASCSYLQTGLTNCDAVLCAVDLFSRIAETLGIFFSLRERSVQRIQLFCALDRICSAIGFKRRTGRIDGAGGRDKQARENGKRVFLRPIYSRRDCFSEAVTKHDCVEIT